ncbi:major capsid protein [Mycolicibacter heraklionensis]|uniref:major capsid protein n=1 Tax=Mycolicibacter heraklionensis TaxID=512402 RepID=UPI00069C1FAD|nr:major capsid protein [Mycolicibacter heraklionensis]
MSLFFDGPVPIEDAITFTQAQPIPSNNALTQMFPRRDFDTDEVDFGTIFKTNRVVKFRNWDGSFEPVARDTGQDKRIKLLPLGGTLETGEYERRQIEHARTGGTFVQSLVSAIYNDLENLTRYAFNRLELAWGDVLSDGRIDINENGVNLSLDFGLKSSQQVTPAGSLWSDHANSKPLDDLRAWRAAYVKENGVPPAQYLTSSEVLANLQVNTQLINAIKGAQTGVTTVTIQEINGLLAGFGLPAFIVPPDLQNGGSLYDSNMDVDGEAVRVLDASKLLMLPANLGDLGFTAWGTPTTAYELKNSGVQTTPAPGMVGILVREDNPPFRKNVYVDAVGLPVISDPRKLLIATVA